MLRMKRIVSVALVTLFVCASQIDTVAAGKAKISNVIPRVDDTGEIVPLADGSLVEHDGIYYLFGVRYQACPVSQQSNCYNPCGYYNNSFAVWVSKDLEK
jgi:hypothetical protein